MASERIVAGIRCTEVLVDLSDYVDGQLGPHRVQQIETHLRGCDWCERFGGEFSRAVAALRQALAHPPGPSGDLRKRLRERLRSEIRALRRGD